MPRANSIWTAERDGGLRALRQRYGARATAKRMGLTIGQVSGRSRVLNLQPSKRRGGVTLHPRHPAVVEARSLFQHRRPSDTAPVLHPGTDQVKLGGRVSKGYWRSCKIFSLTLEERATCPRSCAQWHSCYGNSMNFAVRHQAGPDLEARIAGELAILQRRYPWGFLIRLHILGDFYSPEYVDQWFGWLCQFPALRVFGYTAWPSDSPIGQRITDLHAVFPGRIAIRTSGGKPGEFRSIVIDRHDEPKVCAAFEGAIICPVETGQTRSCATCGLCWTTPRTIAFLRH